MKIKKSLKWKQALLSGSVLALTWCLLPADGMATTLKEALESAYDTNPAIKASQANLGATDEGVAQAISEWRPQISATYERGREKTAINGAAATYNNTDVRRLQMSQPIFSGGGTVARTKSAKKRVMAERENLRTLVQDTLLQATLSYMDVVRDEQLLKLGKHNERVLEEQLKAARERFAVGEVTRTDVAQAEARLSNAVSETVQAEGALTTSQAAYERVIGQAPVNLGGEFSLPSLPATLDEAIEIALAKNPALKAAEYTEEAAKYDEYSNQANLLPAVALIGSMSRDQGAGFFGGTEIDNDSVTLNVTMPLYQSGSEYSRIRQAKKITQRRRFDMESTRDRIVAAVIQLWKQVDTTRATIKATKDAIKAAEVALDGVSQEAKYGARTTLDILDAEQELFQARVNLVSAERDAVIAVFNLSSVLGELSVETLGLEVTPFDPVENYDNVKYKMLGW